MKQDVLSINLLFPVLNERLRLENGIERSMAYLKENVTIPYQLHQLGIENMSAYLRKMAIDGYAAKPDLPERREPKNP